MTVSGVWGITQTHSAPNRMHTKLTAVAVGISHLPHSRQKGNRRTKSVAGCPWVYSLSSPYLSPFERPNGPHELLRAIIF